MQALLTIRIESEADHGEAGGDEATGLTDRFGVAHIVLMLSSAVSRRALRRSRAAGRLRLPRRNALETPKSSSVWTIAVGCRKTSSAQVASHLG